MVLICGSRNGDGEALYRRLRDDLIPCAFADLTNGMMAACHKVPFVYFAEDSNAWNGGIRRTVSPVRCFSCAPDCDSAAFVRTNMMTLYGIDMQNCCCGDIEIHNGIVYFRGNAMHLTKNERRILHLLMFSPGQYFTADETAAFCLTGDAGAAAVHVCNLNQKTVQITGRKIITAKRFSGYKITPNE